MQAPRSPKPRRRRAVPIVRIALTVLALLATVHYISLQRRAHACGGSGTGNGVSSSGSHTDRTAAASNGAAAGNTAAVGSAARSRRIPHILHQSWKTDAVPERFHAWQASWRDTHPQWEFRLWTDADNRRLLEEHYPWFLKTYDALPKPIMRADAIRPFYMHRHGDVRVDLTMQALKATKPLPQGGVYADLDMEALKNTEPLLAGSLPVLARLGDLPDSQLRHNIPNAWMASPPGHPFWQFCWAHTMLEFRPGVSDAEYFNEGIEAVTGPRALMECKEAYEAATGRNVTVLQPGTIFAYDWHKVTYCRTPECIQRVQQCGANEPTFDPTACKKHYPDAFAITYWAHTWGADKTAAKGAAQAAQQAQQLAGADGQQAGQTQQQAGAGGQQADAAAAASAGAGDAAAGGSAAGGAAADTAGVAADPGG